MKKILLSILPLFAALLFTGDLYSQSTRSSSQDSSSLASSLARGTGKAAIIVVGSAAEATWVTTKFTAKHMVKPVAKTIFLKAIPKATLFAIKRSPAVTKKIAPTLLKIALL